MRDNPHQLLPTPDMIATLRTAAKVAWTFREDEYFQHVKINALQVPDEKGHKRSVPVIATRDVPIEVAGDDAWYDIDHRRLYINMTELRTEVHLFYVLLHEAVHAIQFIGQPRLDRMATAALALKWKRRRESKTKAEKSADYFLERTEFDAYTVVLAQMTVDFLEWVERTEGLTQPLVSELRRALRQKTDPLFSFLGALNEILKYFGRQAMASEMRAELKALYLPWYGGGVPEAEMLRLQESAVNKLWYAIEEWKATR